jgi:hypothetical protein
MRMPVEIREAIFGYLVEDNCSLGAHELVEPEENCNCTKSDYKSDYIRTKKQHKLALYRSKDFLGLAFRRKQVRFECCCSLVALLEKDPWFVENLRDVELTWLGNACPLAFKMLSRCPRLEHLKLGILNQTMRILTERAQEMKKHFPRDEVRLSDIDGIDELLALRGLRSVQVLESYNFWGFDRGGLEAMLRQLLLRKPCRWRIVISLVFQRLMRSQNLTFRLAGWGRFPQRSSFEICKRKQSFDQARAPSTLALKKAAWFM